MSDSPDDVVRVASGSLVQMELYQTGLREAGIESKVVGQELDTGLGTALLMSVELWVHRKDAEAAGRAIAEIETERGGVEPPEAVGAPDEE